MAVRAAARGPLAVLLTAALTRAERFMRTTLGS